MEIINGITVHNVRDQEKAWVHAELTLTLRLIKSEIDDFIKKEIYENNGEDAAKLAGIDMDLYRWVREKNVDLLFKNPDFIKLVQEAYQSVADLIEVQSRPIHPGRTLKLTINDDLSFIARVEDLK